MEQGQERGDLFLCFFPSMSLEVINIITLIHTKYEYHQTYIKILIIHDSL